MKKLIVLTFLLSAFSFTATADDFIYLTEKIGDYTLVEPATVYTKADIYEYINGQAVFYFAYGFTRMEHGYYAKGEDTYYVDVYELGSDLSAFGAFRQQREQDATPIKVGAEGAQTDYLTVFWKGNRYVEIIPMSMGEADLKGMLEIARVVDRRIKAKASLPRELSLLPKKGLVQGSERYVDENLMSYSFMGRGLTATYSLPAGDFRVFVSFGENAESADANYSGYAEKLTESSTVKIGRSEGMKGQEPYRGTTIISREGRFVYGAVDVKDESQALGVLGQIQRSLSKQK